MLKPASLYKDELKKCFLELKYDEDMFYYTGYLGNSVPEIPDTQDGSLYQYAIVNDEDVLLGYFTFTIDWYSSCASQFGLISFYRNAPIVGIDAYREIKRIIRHLHRIEWRMIGGNPVEKHYDRFCKYYNGSKHILKDVIKDKKGKYHDDVIYEIITNQDEKDLSEREY